MIGTLAVDGWALAFGTARRGLVGLRPRPFPSLLYQMQEPTHQRPLYQLYIIRRGTNNYVCTLKGYVVNNDNDDKTVIAIV